MSAAAPAGGGSAMARRMWQGLETLHMTVYFNPEPRDAYRRAGLRGGWMGYFASRAAAMGPVPAEVVAATFYNFHPRMVHRAIPDAWGFASPADVLAARFEGAGAALRRLLGRWVEGPEAAEAAAAGQLPGPVLREYRGWSEGEWAAAAGRLQRRGWLEGDGSLTEAGRATRDAREHRTDELAMPPWHQLGEDGCGRLLDLLDHPVRLVVDARGIPFPNPVGLPASPA